MEVFHALFSPVEVKADQKVLDAALSAAVWLHDVDLIKVVLELGIEKPIFGTLEYFGHKVASCLQELGGNVESCHQELGLDVLVHIVEASDVRGSITDHKVALIACFNLFKPLKASRIWANVSFLVISPVMWCTLSIGAVSCKSTDTILNPYTLSSGPKNPLSPSLLRHT